MNILKHTIKKFIYGTLPYYFMKGYKPGSPYLKYYEYIKEHGYSRHLYEFKDEYANMPVDIQKDDQFHFCQFTLPFLFRVYINVKLDIIESGSICSVIRSAGL